MNLNLFSLEFGQYQSILNEMTALVDTADPRSLTLDMSSQVNRLAIAAREPVDLNRVEEAIGGLLWYISELCTHYHLDFGGVALKDLQRRKKLGVFVNIDRSTDG